MTNSGRAGRKAVRGRGFRAAFIPVMAVALAAFTAGPALGNHDPAQSAGSSNSGDAEATTGGNTSTGNDSTNTADNNSTGVLGGLIGATVGLGGTGNQSTGGSAINSGPATAAGNQSRTSGTQNQGGPGSGTGGSGFFTTADDDDGQHASVANSGDGRANTGGNNSTGNDSVNNVSTNQNVSGGLIGVGVNLGSTSNNSNGTSNVNTGAANALGNVSDNSVTQNRGGAGECSRRGFFDDNDGQRVRVANSGSAEADTGRNTSTGNDSQNNVETGADLTDNPAPGVTLLPGVTLPQLIGAGVNLGDTTNNSDGTSAVTTGAANAAGNQSSNSVTQNCGHVRPVVLHAPHFGDKVHGQPFFDRDGRRVIHGDVVRSGTKGVLAVTGRSSGELAGIALALLVVGVLLAGSARRRIVAHREAAKAVAVKRGWEPELRFAARKRTGDIWDDLVLGETSGLRTGDDGPSKVEELV